MAAVDFAEVILEESPLNENSNTATVGSRLATEKLYPPHRGISLVPSPQPLDRSDEQRNLGASPPSLVDNYQPAGDLATRAYAKSLTWWLTIAGFAGVHTAGDGVITDPDAVVIPAGAERWVFTKRNSIIAQTAQLRLNYKDEDVQLRGRGFALSSLSLNAAGEMTGTLEGLVLARLATDATTVPSYPSLALQPFRRGNFFLSTLAGGIVSDFQWNWAQAVERINTLSLDPPSFFPDSLEYGDEFGKATMTIPKRTLHQADVDALLAMSTFSTKARWQTVAHIGATSYPYSLWIEMPATQMLDGSFDALGNKQRHGASYGLQAAYDEASGYDIKITLVNDVTSVATYA